MDNMLYCDTCKIPYGEEQETCSKCGGSLRRFGPDDLIDPHELARSGALQWVRVADDLDEIEAQSIADLLKNRGIPAVTNVSEHGITMQVYLGHSDFGYEVYIPEKLKGEAEEEIEGFYNTPTDL